MEIYLIILTAVLFAAPVYYPSLFFLTWAAFIPLIVLTDDENYRHAFLIALIIGILTSILKFYWLYQPISQQLEMPFSFVLLILILYFAAAALPISIWIILNKFLQPENSFSPFIAALSWSSIEYIRFNYFNINPFNFLAYEQTGFKSMTSFAAYGGIFLVSFLSVLIAGYLVKIYFKPSFKKTVPLIIILILIFSIPFLDSNNRDQGKIYKNVEILNIDTPEKENIFETVEKNSIRTAELIKKSSSDYLFTPENFLGFDLIRNYHYREKLFSDLENIMDGKVLQLGSKAGFDEDYSREAVSSLFLIDEDLEIIDRFQQDGSLLKRNNIIFKNNIMSILKIAADLNFEQSVMKKEIIERDDLRFINILSEEMYNPIEKDIYNDNFNLAINSADESNINSKVYSNYSWAAAVLRAAENKVSVLRAVKGGISGYIGPNLKRVFKSEDEGIITAEVVLNTSSTYYQKQNSRAAEIIIFLTTLIAAAKIFTAAKNNYSNL